MGCETFYVKAADTGSGFLKLRKEKHVLIWNYNFFLWKITKMFTLRQKVVMWALYSRIIVICLQVSTLSILLRLQKKKLKKKKIHNTMRLFFQFHEKISFITVFCQSCSGTNKWRHHWGKWWESTSEQNPISMGTFGFYPGLIRTYSSSQPPRSHSQWHHFHAHWRTHFQKWIGSSA